MSWHCKNLGDAMLADPALAQLQADFRAVLDGDIRATDDGVDGDFGGMALFVRHESGQLHCEVKVYFSPAAAAVAKSLGALMCAKPGKYGLSLLAGDDNAWQLFEG